MPLTTILIIDDDPDDIEMFCEAVNELNSDLDCVKALSGVEALDMLDNHVVQPGLIFLDLNMPGLSGKQFLKKIKEKKSHADIPVYIYSTSNLKADIDDAHQLGCEGFIIKPYSYNDLKDTLAKCLIVHSDK